MIKETYIRDVKFFVDNDNQLLFTEHETKQARKRYKNEMAKKVVDRI
jgi:hypothetical protein